jgi:hypothetical protein
VLLAEQAATNDLSSSGLLLDSAGGRESLRRFALEPLPAFSGRFAHGLGTP